jgi:hypothetical protein
MPKSKKNSDVFSEKQLKLQRQGASTDRSYQPIASELADEDEAFQKKTLGLEVPNNLVFSPRRIKVRVPTSARIRSSQQASPLVDQKNVSRKN